MITKTFSLQARLKSFDHAIDGLVHFYKTEYNAWLHTLATLLVVILSVIYHVSVTELIAIVFSIGLVFVTEMLNTAIEKSIDFVSTVRHPQIKIIKDVAASAVLFASITALVTGSVIFIPKIISSL